MRFKKLHYLYHRFQIHKTLKNPYPEIIDDETQDFSETLIKKTIDPLNNEYIHNPYEIFSYLRKNEPIHRSQTGAWALTRYNDITEALGDERLGNAPSDFSVINQKNINKYVCASIANNTLPFIDPPNHTLIRTLISKSFHAYLETYPPNVKNIADEFLESLTKQNSFDLLHDFASPFTCKVFSDLMGFPDENQNELIKWSERFLYLFTIIPSETVQQNIDSAVNEFREYIKTKIETQKTNNDNTLLKHLLKTGSSNNIDMNVIIDNCILLFADGIGNTDKAIANIFMTLKNHQDQLQKLLQNQALIPNAVEECLRYETPAQYIGRIAKKDLHLHGQLIRKNEMVILVLASANRDEEVFSSPDTIDIKRKQNKHISFGKNRHSCLGSRLVRMEIESAIQSFLPCIDQIKLVNNEPEWDARPGHRWLKNCPVTMHR